MLHQKQLVILRDMQTQRYKKLELQHYWSRVKTSENASKIPLKE